MPIRHRILPRTVLGISLLLLFASLGAAFSGAILYAYYEYRLDETESRVEQFIASFEDDLDEARDTIAEEREAAIDAVEAATASVKRITASGDTIDAAIEVVSPSLFFVSTLNEIGEPSVGAAFVAFSDSSQSFLLASYTTVRAATTSPAPPIRVRRGGEELDATLWTWDEARDLALLIVNQPNLPRLDWRTDSPRAGDRVFVVAGLGTRGAAITQGFIADVSSAGLQHDAAIGPQFQGGPVLDADNRVIGIASRSYAPLGFRTDEVFFAVPIADACAVVVQCPGGEASGAGSQR